MKEEKIVVGKFIDDFCLSKVNNLLADWYSLEKFKAELIKLIPETVSDLQRRKIINAIEYTGEYPRRFTKLGYLLQKQGSRYYITIDGVKYIKIEKNIQPEFRANIPKCVGDHFLKTAKICNLSGAVLNKIFERDHRVPFGRIKQEEQLNEDLSVDQIENLFQAVSSNANTKKREKCNRCIETGIRPGGTYQANINFWFKGDENYVNTCEGCFWSYPEQWASALNKKLGEL